MEINVFSSENNPHPTAFKLFQNLVVRHYLADQYRSPEGLAMKPLQGRSLMREREVKIKVAITLRGDVDFQGT